MKRLLALLLLALALWGVSAAVAQEGITIIGLRAENRFPQDVLFSISAQSSAVIEKVVLHYSLSGEGSRAYAQPDFTPGKTVRVEYRLEGNAPPRIYLPPGTVIEYFWEIEDAAGHRLTTTPDVVVYDDTRFEWETLSQGNLTLWWYRGNRRLAEQLLSIGRNTLDRITELTGAEIDFPVKVWAYASVEDMRLAMQRRSEAFSQEVVTLGQRVSRDTVLILLVPGVDETLRHELAHVVTHAAGEGPFGELPAWLDEGTAVYAQQSPGRTYERALTSAIHRDRLFSIRSMSAPTGDPSHVNLWYGQAWSLVRFLVDTYGPDKFAQLFAIFKEGSTVDNALMQVYGFDQDGLEDAWRQSLGLAPRKAPTEPSEEQPQPTPVSPAQEPKQPQPAEPAVGAAAPGGEAFPAVHATLIALLALLLIGTAAWGGRILGQRLR